MKNLHDLKKISSTKLSFFLSLLITILFSGCKPYQIQTCGGALPSGAHFNSNSNRYKKDFNIPVSVVANYGVIGSCSFSCDAGRVYNSQSNACESILPVACTLSDSALNGWDIANAASAMGTKIDNNISNCAIDTCNSLFYKNSTSKLCEKSTRHLVVVAGQSNAIGQASVSSCGSLVTPDPRIEQLSRGLSQTGPCSYSPSTSGTWMMAQDPLQFNAPNSSTSFAMTFAKQYLNNIKSYDTVGLILVASNGTSFYDGSWKTPSGPLFVELKNKVNGELMANPNSRLDAILWQQGESDAVSLYSSKDYETQMRSFVTGLRSGIIGALNVPILIGQMAPALVLSNSYYQMVQDTQLRLPNYFNNIAIVDTSSLVRFDTYHFDLNSTLTLGSRYYSSLSNLNVARVISPITDIIISTTTIDNSVSNQPIFLTKTGGTDSIYSIDVGANNFDVIGNIIYAKVPGLVNGSYPLRITSTSDQGQSYSKDFIITVKTPSISALSLNLSGTSKFCRQSNLVTDFSSAWTVSFLIKHNNSLNGVILDSTLPVTYNGLYIILEQGQIKSFLIQSWPTKIQSVTYTRMDVDKWYRVSITYNGNNSESGINTYIGSNLEEVSKQGVIAAGSLSHSGDICLGNRPIGGSYWPNSVNLDEFTIWNKALSASEVAELNQNQSPLNHSASTNLVQYFKIENPLDIDLVDEKGAGNWIRMNTGFRYDSNYMSN